MGPQNAQHAVDKIKGVIGGAECSGRWNNRIVTGGARGNGRRGERWRTGQNIGCVSVDKAAVACRKERIGLLITSTGVVGSDGKLGLGDAYLAGGESEGVVGCGQRAQR